jgi:hypothetical protein
MRPLRRTDNFTTFIFRLSCNLRSSKSWKSQGPSKPVQESPGFNSLQLCKVKVPRNRPEGLEGGRGIDLPFLDLGTRRVGWTAPRPDRFTPTKDPVPILQEAGRASGPVWTCAKNLVPTGIRSPDLPARSQSL